MKIKLENSKIFFVLLGLFYVFFYIYRRLKIRYEWNFLYFFLNINVIFLILILIGLFLILYKIIFKKSSENKIIIYFTYLYFQYYDRPLKELNIFLVHNWYFYGGIQEFFSNLLNWIYKNNLKYIFITFFVILPRIIIIVVFLIELFLTSKLYYTLYCLLLLIIPILVRLFFYLSFDFLNNNYENIKKYADIEFIGGALLEQYEGYCFTLKDIKDDDEIDLDKLKEFHYILELIIPRMPMWMDLKIMTDNINKYLIIIWFLVLFIVFFIIFLLKIRFLFI
jgi:hypothetical protein